MAAPPYIVFRNPYGGLGLRARSVEAARARIDGLLEHCAVEVELLDVELEVEEQCPRSMVDGVLADGVSAVSTGARRLEIPAAQLVADHGHQPDVLARDAWNTLGPPNGLGSDLDRHSSRARWTWKADGPAAHGVIEAWSAFLIRHQALAINEWKHRVNLHVRYDFLLCRAGQALPDDEYPRSRVSASLRGRHASAFLDPVFPYGGVEPAFIDDYRALCAAMALRLSPASFQLNTPTKNGGRKLVRLPPFA
jgi:hypothetical protein